MPLDGMGAMPFNVSSCGRQNMKQRWAPGETMRGRRPQTTKGKTTLECVRTDSGRECPKGYTCNKLRDDLWQRMYTKQSLRLFIKTWDLGSDFGAVAVKVWDVGGEAGAKY